MYTIVVVIVMSLFKPEFRLTPRKLLKGLSDAADDALTVTGACAAAGIVIAMVLLTGLGVKIGNLVMYLSAGNLGLALFFIMIASLILGMGLPTIVCYILLAVTTAPPLIQMGVPPMAAHFFIFYFGMLSMVTPPVGMAFYAGAALAGADTMQTGWTAWKISLASFLVPYAFVYNPSLLMMGHVSDAILSGITSVIGATALAAGVVGHMRRPLGALERIAAIAAALLLIKPGWITDLVGVVIVVILLFLQWKKETTLHLGKT
jgi:TRAP-type uncharacterized transport system fused permease subunit